MSFYDKPLSNSIVYNDDNYATPGETNDTQTIDLSQYLRKSGDIMTGSLSTPDISIYNNGNIEFQTNDGNKIFNKGHVIDIEDSKNKLSNITYDNNDTRINGNLSFSDNTIQTSGYTTAEKATVADSFYRLSKISYDNGLIKTNISNNCYIETLTAGNINTSHLNNTSSNLQTQITNNGTSINNINNTLTNISYTNTDTDISGSVFVDKIIFPDLTEQTSAFSHIIELDSNTYKLTDIAYDDSLLTTTINNKCVIDDFLTNTITFNDTTTQNSAFDTVYKSALDSYILNKDSYDFYISDVLNKPKIAYQYNFNDVIIAETGRDTLGSLSITAPATLMMLDPITYIKLFKDKMYAISATVNLKNLHYLAHLEYTIQLTFNNYSEVPESLSINPCKVVFNGVNGGEFNEYSLAHTTFIFKANQDYVNTVLFRFRIKHKADSIDDAKLLINAVGMLWSI